MLRNAFGILEEQGQEKQEKHMEEEENSLFFNLQAV